MSRGPGSPPWHCLCREDSRAGPRPRTRRRCDVCGSVRAGSGVTGSRLDNVATSWAPAPVRENSHLVEELRASRLRIVQATEGERRRLEQDLHDGAQLRLVEIHVRLGMVRDLVDRSDLEREPEAVQRTRSGWRAALSCRALRGSDPGDRRRDGQVLGSDRSSGLFLCTGSDPEHSALASPTIAFTARRQRRPTRPIRGRVADADVLDRAANEPPTGSMSRSRSSMATGLAESRSRSRPEPRHGNRS